MAWQAPKLDWNTNPISPTKEVFNRIEGNIQFLNEEIANKKNVIANAINQKGMYIAPTSSFEDMANKINDIHKKPRMAKGTGTLLQYGNNDVRLDIGTMTFKPSRVFIRGTVSIRGSDSNSNGTYSENWRTVNFSIVDNILSPSIYFIQYYVYFPGTMQNPIYLNSEVGISGTLTFTDYGFSLKLNSTYSPAEIKVSDSNNIYWYAYEQEG